MFFRDREKIALGAILVVADGQSTFPSGSFARTDLNFIPISQTHDLRSVMPHDCHVFAETINC